GYQNSEIISDSAEQRLIAELKTMGIRKIRPARKGKGSIMYGIDFMQGFKIHILPKCVNAIAEFNSYAYDRDKQTGQYINKPIDKDNHFI
ncbi:terminase large subunit, partial [Onishia niordana]